MVRVEFNAPLDVYGFVKERSQLMGVPVSTYVLWLVRKEIERITVAELKARQERNQT